MNVLLVDDEPLELEQLEFLIKPEFPEWVLYKAHDSRQAMEIAGQVPVHLSFLDIHLPGASGLELGRELRASRKEMDMIMVTAYQNFQYAKESIGLGVVGYITKPLIQSEFLEALEKYKDPGNNGLAAAGMTDGITTKSSVSGELARSGFSSGSARHSDLIKRALAVIHERYAERLSLQDVAEAIHVNATYLSRRFHEEVGPSFSEYMIQYRIEQSRTLLLSTRKWSMSEIAEQTGFNSQHYFSTMFRKVTGVSPKEFREKGI
ncbi:chemotaxis protein CheY [Paenibacillus swuensis]|uniref:Chemotaxis protein CheY n=1 Tax=Paenibacillus swuensis TaxID=1178515 RepID=A0A172TE35_9BACL|nr:helix-turn-helix domain-containing protein [Paenibacillus swuensis]ANE45196.1 chemotaxis protein CheY [Paenibacillus swuensis]